MRRILSFLLALLLCVFSVIPASATDGNMDGGGGGMGDLEVEKPRCY